MQARNCLAQERSSSRPRAHSSAAQGGQRVRSDLRRCCRIPGQRRPDARIAQSGWQTLGGRCKCAAGLARRSGGSARRSGAPKVPKYGRPSGGARAACLDGLAAREEEGHGDARDARHLDLVEHALELGEEAERQQRVLEAVDREAPPRLRRPALKVRDRAMMHVLLLLACAAAILFSALPSWGSYGSGRGQHDSGGDGVHSGRERAARTEEREAKVAAAPQGCKGDNAAAADTGRGDPGLRAPGSPCCEFRDR